MTHALDLSIALLLRASLRDEETLAYPVHDEIFGFHAQQAVEKLLKAWIAGHGMRYQRTHDLTELHLELQAVGETLPPETGALLSLSTFAVEWRYQEAAGVNPPERAKLIEQIVALRTHVYARLSILRSGVNWM